MPEIWPVNLSPDDKAAVTSLAQRRAALGLVHTFAETIRASVALASTASDDDLRAGEILDPPVSRPGV